MFPLYSETVLLLALGVLAGAVAAGIVRFGALRLGPAVALLGLGAVWPWPFAASVRLDHYVMAAAMGASLATLAALAIGIVWGSVARRLFQGRALLGAVALPILLGALVLLEGQRVPQAPCAERVLFALGDLTLAVPREVGARSSQAEDAPRQKWSGAYSDWAGAKPSVRALCRATDGGRTPLEVAHLSLPAGSFRRSLEADCAAGGPQRPTPEICAAAARTALTIVQIHARPDGLLGPTLGLFNSERVRGSLLHGARAGLRCNDEVNGPKSRYCSIWQVQPSGQLVLMAARLGPKQPGEDTGRDAALLLDAFLAHLSPAVPAQPGLQSLP